MRAIASGGLAEKRPITSMSHLPGLCLLCRWLKCHLTQQPAAVNSSTSPLCRSARISNELNERRSAWDACDGIGGDGVPRTGLSRSSSGQSCLHAQFEVIRAIMLDDSTCVLHEKIMQRPVEVEKDGGWCRWMVDGGGGWWIVDGGSGRLRWRECVLCVSVWI